MAKWIWMAGLIGLLGCARQPPHLPEWNEDLATAARTARDNGRMLLLNFSGSDWCGWCIRLEQEVFSQEAFRDYAAQHLEMVLVDFPRRTRQPEAVREQNERLRRHFNVRGFPTLLLFSPDGRLMGRLGYQPGGPEPFIRSIREAQAQFPKAAPDPSPAARLPI